MKPDLYITERKSYILSLFRACHKYHAGAVGSVIANPVLETNRVDTRLISDDGE